MDDKAKDEGRTDPSNQLTTPPVHTERTTGWPHINQTSRGSPLCQQLVLMMIIDNLLPFFRKRRVLLHMKPEAEPSSSSSFTSAGACLAKTPASTRLCLPAFLPSCWLVDDAFSLSSSLFFSEPCQKPKKKTTVGRSCRRTCRSQLAFHWQTAHFDCS